MAKNERLIGLEIGDGLVKAIDIFSNNKENVVKNYARVPVNFREGREGIVKAIKDVLQKIGVKKGAKINITVSGESVMVRDIHWPKMTDSEIRNALQFEVQRQINCKPEDIIFDYYSVQDKTLTDTKTRLVLVAAKKDIIENYAGLISAAGFGCGIIEVDTFSLLNCFYCNGPQVSPEKNIALVNVGMEVTNIDIIKGKVVGLTKDAFVAWNNFIDAVPPEITIDFNNTSLLKGVMGSDDLYELCLFITNALSNQVRRSIEFYESQGRFTVEEIYLSGKIAQFKNLDKFLQNIIGLKVTLWDPIAKLKYEKNKPFVQELQADALMMAVCAGLACRRSFHINLSLTPAAAVKAADLGAKLAPYKMLIVAYSVLFFFLAGLWLMIANQIGVKQRVLAELTEKNKNLLLLVEEVKKLETIRGKFGEHMKAVRALFTQRTLWARKLNALSAHASKRICLTEFSIKSQERTKVAVAAATVNPAEAAPEERIPPLLTLSLKGIVYTDENEMLAELNKFLNEIKADNDFIGDFASIELVRSYADSVEDKPVMRFELVGNVKSKINL